MPFGFISKLLNYKTGDPDPSSIPQEEPVQGGLIERNNQMAKEWEDTNTKRDKLKLLQVSANAETDKKPFGG